MATCQMQLASPRPQQWWSGTETELANITLDLLFFLLMEQRRWLCMVNIQKVFHLIFGILIRRWLEVQIADLTYPSTVPLASSGVCLAWWNFAWVSTVFEDSGTEGGCWEIVFADPDGSPTRFCSRNPWSEQMLAELESCSGVSPVTPHQQAFDLLPLEYHPGILGYQCLYWGIYHDHVCLMYPRSPWEDGCLPIAIGGKRLE